MRSAYKIRVKEGARLLGRLISNLDLEPQCEILVPAFSHTDLGVQVLSGGCHPVYVDVDGRGLLSVEAAWRKVKSEFVRRGGAWYHRRRGGRLVALAIAHPGGLTPNLDEVWRFAEELGLLVIDDARGALGARAWARGDWVEAGAAGHVGLASAFGEVYAYASSPRLLEGLPAEEGPETPGHVLRHWFRESLRKLGLASKALPAPPWCEPAGEVALVRGRGSSELWPKAVLVRDVGRCSYRKGSCPNAERLAESLEPVRLPKPQGAELPGTVALAQSIG